MPNSSYRGNQQIETLYESKKAFWLELLFMTMFPKNMQTIRICRSSKKIYIFFNCLVSAKLNLDLFMLLEYAKYPLASRGYVDLGSFPSVIQCQRFPFAGSF
jgi:hypothetical protein